MTNRLIISVSGLRGIVGESLTPEVGRRYAAAFAVTLPEGPVLITRYGRANGGQLVGPVVAGLSQGGSRPVLDAGIAATPTTGVLVRHHRCVGGVQISASHNPAEYNGLKLFSAGGRVVPGEMGRDVQARFEAEMSLESALVKFAGTSGQARHGESSTSTGTHKLAETTSQHLALIASIVDVEQIRAKKFRVLLDANHGSGSVLGRPLLERLGCDVVALGGSPDGHFAHPPEPTAENLAGVLAEVTSAGAQIGFCQDPDADRLAIVDEQGRYLGEEYTLALCVDHVLRARAGPVVTNCSTSRMAEDLARKYHVPFHRSAVGEALVVDEMLRQKAVIGGEGNGGVIDLRVGPVRDSFVGMALVLEAMAARDAPISALADELPRYAIWKTKIELPAEAVAAAFNSLERRFPEASSDRLDGLRLDWPRDGRGERRGAWLLVRPSNTEPIVRIIAEAATEEEARGLCHEAVRVIAASR